MAHYEIIGGERIMSDVSSNDSTSLFERIGGKPYLQKISKRFYDKLYTHPWMKNFFKNTRQEVIESQQVDFMTGALGGPRVYSGRLPIDAHPHIHITPEVFELREKILIETLHEENAPQELVDRWLKIENAFKRQLIKSSVTECKKRWTTDEILDFENPEKSQHFSPYRKAS
jgi:truncated hemoglobin YjbI